MLQLIPFYLVLFVAISSSFGAPLLVPRTGDGCYVVMTPNVAQEMIKNVTTGDYTVYIKFGDSGSDEGRAKAYSTGNPSHRFKYANFRSAQCGHKTEAASLEKLADPKKGIFRTLSTSGSKKALEWYSICLGTNEAAAKRWYTELIQMSRDWADKEWKDEDEMLRFASTNITRTIRAMAKPPSPRIPPRRNSS
ncbi:hypothetical protein C8J56DRAFT_1166320 [Mycena floridula]|nr:hypothetical protein C8J56DRAFT_1166320 [Mycena floridula]